MSEEWTCQRCGKSGPKLEHAPYPGELGVEISQKVCKLCWQEWMRVQMMVINEYRVNLADKRGVQTVEEQMKKFLLAGAGAVPEGYVPPAKHNHG